MANNFTSTLNPNISNSVATTLYTAGQANASILLGVMLSNTSTTGITVTVTLTRSATTTNIVKNLAIPAGSSFDIMQGNKIVLLQSDVLKALASAATSCDATVSVLEGVT